MTALLLATKLYLPPALPGLVNRPRLLRRAVALISPALTAYISILGGENQGAMMGMNTTGWFALTTPIYRTLSSNPGSARPLLHGLKPSFSKSPPAASSKARVSFTRELLSSSYQAANLLFGLIAHQVVSHL